MGGLGIWVARNEADLHQFSSLLTKPHLHHPYLDPSLPSTSPPLEDAQSMDLQLTSHLWFAFSKARGSPYHHHLNDLTQIYTLPLL